MLEAQNPEKCLIIPGLKKGGQKVMTTSTGRQPVREIVPAKTWIPAVIFTGLSFLFLAIAFFLVERLSNDQRTIMNYVFAFCSGMSIYFIGGSATLKYNLQAAGIKLAFGAVGGVAMFALVYLNPLFRPVPPNPDNEKTQAEKTNLSTLPSNADILPRENPRDKLIYVRIPAARPFLMGCSRLDSECDNANEKPAHPVTIKHAFWLGQTTVTQAAYLRVMGQNPSSSQGYLLPVNNVTWFNARDYCQRVGMRLPTEAEWEYAARAGEEDRSRYGDIDKIAWYSDNSDRHTHNVGSKDSNTWQLFDMLGNVWQWTADWYDRDYYSQFSLSEAAPDPQGPTSGRMYYRSLRGGGCFSLDTDVRFSSRYKSRPERGAHDIGFRCAGETIPEAAQPH